MTGHRICPWATGITVLMLAACGKVPAAQESAAESSTAPQGTTLLKAAGPVETVPPAQLAAPIFEAQRWEACWNGALESGDTHNATPEKLAEGRALDAWFDRTISAHPDMFSLVSETRDGPGWSGSGKGWKSTTRKFAHTEGDRTMELTVDRVWGTANRALSDTADREYLKVYSAFCAWVPSHVEIVSMDGSAEANRYEVRFKLHRGLTELARLARESGARIVNTDAPQPRVGSADVTRQGPGEPWEARVTDCEDGRGPPCER